MKPKTTPDPCAIMSESGCLKANTAALKKMIAAGLELIVLKDREFAALVAKLKKP